VLEVLIKSAVTTIPKSCNSLNLLVSFLTSGTRIILLIYQAAFVLCIADLVKYSTEAQGNKMLPGV
jgi:hypothetical protein